MKKLGPNLFIDEKTSLREAMAVLDDSPFSYGLIVRGERELIGVLCDNEIRTAIIRGADEEQPVSTLIEREPLFLKMSDLSNIDKKEELIKKFLHRSTIAKTPTFPLLNERNEVVDFLTFQQLIDERNSILNSTTTVDRKVGRVLIIGGGGYLGSALVKQLVAKQYNVRVFDNFIFGKASIDDFGDSDYVEIYEGDIRNISDVTRAMEDIDAVVLLAAIVGDPASKHEPTKTIEVNYLAAKNVAEACKYQQINRLIYASTCSVYGQQIDGSSDDLLTENSALNPVSLYARTKIKTEQGILELADGNFSPAILRMATLYGHSSRMRYDLVVNTLMMKAIYEGEISIFGGNQWRPLLHVDDAADAYVKCLEAPLGQIKGQIFNVGDDLENFQIKHLGQMIKDLFGPRLILNINNDAFDARDYKVSFQKIKSTLGFDVKRRLPSHLPEMRDLIEQSLGNNPYDETFYNYFGPELAIKRDEFFESIKQRDFYENTL